MEGGVLIRKWRGRGRVGRGKEEKALT